MFGSGLPGGIHNDVLNANPTEQAEKEKLVDEIKSRAKNSIKYGNFPEAIQLYTKAIELLPSNSILHANRSMCHLTMGTGADAVKDAEKAVELDPSYAKAYYRLGAAQFHTQAFDEAIASLKKGLTLVPDDKDMAAKLKAVETAMEKKSSNAPIQASSTSSSSPSSSSASIPKRSTSTAPSSKKVYAGNAEKDDDDADDLKGLRGYKKTSDGRTTTFFNNELDEKTKSLIGDITPKALDSSAAAAAAAAVSTTPSGGSAWNTAGTFESKNVTPWAKERINELLSAVTFEGGACVGSIKNVKEVTGDAEITMNRGKRKFLCDFDTTVEWELASGGTHKGTGSMIVRDINAEKEYDFQVTVDSTSSREVAADVNAYVKSSSTGLQKAIFKALDEFFKDFHSK